MGSGSIQRLMDGYYGFWLHSKADQHLYERSDNCSREEYWLGFLQSA